MLKVVFIKAEKIIPCLLKIFYVSMNIFYYFLYIMIKNLDAVLRAKEKKIFESLEKIILYF